MADMCVRLLEKVSLMWVQNRHSSGKKSMSISLSKSESESSSSSSDEGDFDFGSFDFEDGLSGGVMVVPGSATLQRSLYTLK